MRSLLSFIQEDLAAVIGWTLVHSIWQGCLLGLLLAFALSRIPDTKSRLRYQVSLTALFVLFSAVLITFLYQLPRHGEGSFVAVGPIWQTDLRAGQAAPVESWSRQWMSQWIEDHSVWLAAVWMIGLVLSFLRLGLNLRYTAYLRNHYTYALPKEWNDYFKTLVDRYAISKPVTWMESALVSSPVLLGHLKPLILFPIGLVNQLTPRETEAILAHELTHIANCDYLVNVCQSFVEALLYYHPAVWWISQRIRDTREQRCDDRVVGAICDPLTYAKALTKTEAFLQGPKPVLALSATDSKYKLLHRMQRVLIPSSNPVTTMEKRTFILLLLTLVGALILHVETSYASKSALSWLPNLDKVKSWVFTDTMPAKAKPAPKARPQDLKVEVKNGEIKKLVVDGKVIPKDRYDEYEYLITQPPVPLPPLEHLGDLAPLPPMPDFPDMPDMPSWQGGSRNAGGVGAQWNTIFADSISYYDGGNEHYIYLNDDGHYWTNGPYNVSESDDSLLKVREGVYVFRSPDAKSWGMAYGADPKKREEYKRMAEGYAKDAQRYAKEAQKYTKNREKYAREAQVYARNAEVIARGRSQSDKERKLALAEHELALAQHHKALQQHEIAVARAEKSTRNHEKLLRELAEKEKNQAWGSYYSYELPTINGTAYVPMEGGDQSDFERRLLKDGLIEDASNYSFELSYNHMKVNGKKQNEATLETYKKLYRSVSGKSMDKNDKISIIKQSND